MSDRGHFPQTWPWTPLRILRKVVFVHGPAVDAYLSTAKPLPVAKPVSGCPRRVHGVSTGLSTVDPVDTRPRWCPRWAALPAPIGTVSEELE